ncbi:protein of unknown function [Ruminococcaceae bacterium BL-6]|nr:protein of unknown function [Ruminococcaceae bacterium BL-6]
MLRRRISARQGRAALAGGGEARKAENGGRKQWDNEQGRTDFVDLHVYHLIKNLRREKEFTARKTNPASV